MIHGAGGSMHIWKKQTEDFSREFNLLLLDLRGHGDSVFDNPHIEYTLELIASDVIRLMEHLNIRQSHFVGVSLGALVIRSIELLRHDLIQSIVLAGGIFELNNKLRLLLKSGVALTKILPFQRVYQLYALLLLPRKNHQKSREIFIREARRISENEFVKWVNIAKTVNQQLKRLFSVNPCVPYLVVMGDQDHVFLKPAIQFVKRHNKAALEILGNCGHVCNVEKAAEFNRHAIAFLKEHVHAAQCSASTDAGSHKEKGSFIAALSA
jgi:pimeloyl-ACP methyl ester carboxylesterase